MTAIVIAASHKTTSRETQISEHRAPCPYAAVNVAVAVTLPSGTTLDAVTNAGGQFVINIPRTEANGTITVHALDSHQRLSYRR